MPVPLSKNDLIRFQTNTHPLALVKMLQSFSMHSLTLVPVIKTYHDLLLFHTAFPFNPIIYQLASGELQRIAETVKKNDSSGNTAKQTSLMASGITNSALLCSYSLPLTQWLVKKFPLSTSFGGSDAAREAVKNIFQLLLPSIEFERTSQRELNLTARIKLVSGFQQPVAQLHWLLQAFYDSPLPSAVKDELFGQLKVFTRWQLADEHFSRTAIHLPVKKRWYQKGFIKKISPGSTILQTTGTPVLLSPAARTHLLDSMKASLAFYYRETDPFTYPDEDELELFDMGRGVQIAVVGMQKEKRLSLESYIGYMAFKNGIPVAYGGGWIWGRRCKIGVNIYPPFRKGESAWLFCQVMRLYYQQYGVRRFVIRPYQFGKGNPEGLRSGAFWFYYKLGFRPVEQHIHTDAENEWKKIQTIPHYRTTVEKLQLFTSSDLEWIITADSFPVYGADKISAAISDHINQNFGSVRQKAVIASLKKMNRLFPAALLYNRSLFEQEVTANWSLLTMLIDNINNWTETQKKKLVQLIRLKQIGKESEYIMQLQNHTGLWHSLNTIANKKATKRKAG